MQPGGTPQDMHVALPGYWQLGTSRFPSYQCRYPVFLARAVGLRAPQGCVPWDELFLGLTQAAALSLWGLQEGNAASCLRHWGWGKPLGARGASPVGTQPLWCGTPLLPPCTTHRPPRSCGSPTKSHQVLGAFAKPVREKMMKLERFWWPLPLGPLPYHWLNPFPVSMPRTWNADPQGMLGTANPAKTMRQGWTGNRASM